MNLAALKRLVKPDRTVLAVAFCSTALGLLAALLVVSLTDRAAAQPDRFGAATVTAAAALMAGPMQQDDRLHLGVIGNRLVELAEVRGVASYTLDGELLTSAGDLTGNPYEAMVTLGERPLGTVRITLTPDLFDQTDYRRPLAFALLALFAPLLATLAWNLGSAAARGELQALRPRPTVPPAAGPAPAPAAPADQPEPQSSHFLLAVNLYNQLTLAESEREFEMSLCIELAEEITELYQGQVVTLPGTGVLLDFDVTDDEDRAFQVVCAAFLLQQLLGDEAPFGHYRLGLNLATLPEDATLPLDDDAVADAALLSALARDATLAISATFAAAIGSDSRIHARPLASPLLDQLSCGADGCRLVVELEGTYAARVVQQAALLRAQREAISSPSTF